MNLHSFGGIPTLMGESKPEKGRERGRTAPAFATTLSRGITFNVAALQPETGLAIAAH